MNATQEYAKRECLPEKRRTWRQKVRIHDPVMGTHVFYVEFGDYQDGRLGEVWITAQRMGTFTRGTLDALARSISLSLQSGTSPAQCSLMLLGMDYPPNGPVEAEGSSVTKCSSLADYLGQEIQASYGADGRRIMDVMAAVAADVFDVGETWRSGV